jgi:uncharacterized membrane protein
MSKGVRDQLGGHELGVVEHGGIGLVAGEYSSHMGANDARAEERVGDSEDVLPVGVEWGVHEGDVEG